LPDLQLSQAVRGTDDAT